MIPVGIMTSAGIMVGNNLGANKVATAKAYGMMCFKTGLLWALCTILLLTLFKGPFTGLFSSEQKILDIITTAYPIMLTYVLIDCI